MSCWAWRLSIRFFFFFLQNLNISLVCLTNPQYIDLPPYLLICIQNPVVLCYQGLQNTSLLYPPCLSWEGTSTRFMNPVACPLPLAFRIRFLTDDDHHLCYQDHMMAISYNNNLLCLSVLSLQTHFAGLQLSAIMRTLWLYIWHCIRGLFFS